MCAYIHMSNYEVRRIQHQIYSVEMACAGACVVVPYPAGVFITFPCAGACVIVPYPAGVFITLPDQPHPRLPPTCRHRQVEEIFGGQGESEGELQARVVFSSFSEDRQRVCLRLKDEWPRLAPANSLTDEHMDSGAPLAGDALAASRRQYKPRYLHRRQGRSSAAATEAGANSGSSDGSPTVARVGGGRSGEAEQAIGGIGGGGNQRRRDAGGGGCVAGGGIGGESGGRALDGETTDVANVKAALKVALANNEGDTSEGSGRESSSSSSGGGGGGGGSSTRGRLSRSSAARPSEVRAAAAAAAAAAAGDGAATGSADAGRSAASRLLPKATRQRVRAPSPVAANGGGKYPKINKFFADEETPVVGSAAGRRVAAVRPGSPNNVTGQPQAASGGPRGLEVAGEPTGAEGNHGATARLGRPKKGVGEKKHVGAGGAGASRRKQQTWTLWDMSKPPTVGDRFDCLDYFVSSQVTDALCVFCFLCLRRACVFGRCPCRHFLLCVCVCVCFVLCGW